MPILCKHALPGNVRQLENAMLSLVMNKGNHEVIGPEELALALNPCRPAPHSSRGQPTTSVSEQPLEAHSAAPEVSDNDRAGGVLELKDVSRLLSEVVVSADESLTACFSMLDTAMARLKARCIGAALHTSSIQQGGKPVLTNAMRQVTGDSTLNYRQPKDILMKVLKACPEAETQSDEHTHAWLIKTWKESPGVPAPKRARKSKEQ
jgi:hypothetical protein